jgi:hypothetical protein
LPYFPVLAKSQFFAWVSGLVCFQHFIRKAAGVVHCLGAANAVIYAATNAIAFFALGVITSGVASANTSAGIIDGNQCHGLPPFVFAAAKQERQ